MMSRSWSGELYDALRRSDIAAVAACFASEEGRAKVDATERHVVEHAPDVPDFQLENGETPWFLYPMDLIFNMSIDEGDVEMVQWLLAPERIASMRCTLTMLFPWLCQQAAKESQAEILEVLLTSDLFCAFTEDKQRWILQLSLGEVQFFSDDEAKVLFAHGATIHQANNDDPLPEADRFLQPWDIAELLFTGLITSVNLVVVETVWSPSYRFKKREVIELGDLQLAGQCDHHAFLEVAGACEITRMAALLWGEYVEVDDVNDDGKTALILVVTSHEDEDLQYKAMEYLLDQGAGMEIRDKHGYATLEHAALEDALRAGELLIRCGASTSRVDFICNQAGEVIELTRRRR